MSNGKLNENVAFFPTRKSCTICALKETTTTKNNSKKQVFNKLSIILCYSFNNIGTFKWHFALTPFISSSEIHLFRSKSIEGSSPHPSKVHSKASGRPKKSLKGTLAHATLCTWVQFGVLLIIGIGILVLSWILATVLLAGALLFMASRQPAAHWSAECGGERTARRPLRRMTTPKGLLITPPSLHPFPPPSSPLPWNDTGCGCRKYVLKDCLHSTWQYKLTIKSVNYELAYDESAGQNSSRSLIRSWDFSAFITHPLVTHSHNHFSWSLWLTL